MNQAANEAANSSNVPSQEPVKTTKKRSLPDASHSQKSLPPSVGVHGVRLKHFEQVLANVLPQVEPTYVCLPPPPPPTKQHDGASLFWPFDRLPASARVWGTNPGQLAKPERARRKEQQLQSMLRCILPLVPTSPDNFTIVDFGGGSGHLGIPLALLLPQCRIVVVDLRQRSLDLMHQKVELLLLHAKENPVDSICFRSESSTAQPPPFVDPDSRFHRCGRDGILENLFTFLGPVEQYTEPFDMALALHLCGEATDVTLRKAASVQASAIVVAPCCVGKLSQQVRNPNIYHATGQNTATISYPQSPTFCQVIENQADWDALAKAADYSNEQETRTSRNAARRTAKALLETDRRLFLESEYQYRTALMRMDPWEATPKNDILVAWNPAKVNVGGDNIFCQADLDCQADMQVVRSQLLGSKNSITIDDMNDAKDRNDWTGDEEQAIRDQISNFLLRTETLTDRMEQVFVFPAGMGGRKRKLIHFVARSLDLAHWCVGEKHSQKTVAVARRGQRRH